LTLGLLALTIRALPDYPHRCHYALRIVSVNILAGTISASVRAHGTVNNQATPGTKAWIRSGNGQSNQQWTLG